MHNYWQESNMRIKYSGRKYILRAGAQKEKNTAFAVFLNVL